MRGAKDNAAWIEREGGGTQFEHGRSRMTIDPSIPTMPGRSTRGRSGGGCGGGWTATTTTTTATTTTTTTTTSSVISNDGPKRHTTQAKTAAQAPVAAAQHTS